MEIKKKKSRILIINKSIEKLASKSNQKVLAIWAADCAERVLPYFEKKFPKDNRPRKAIETIRKWTRGKIRFKEIRATSLASHAAARNADKFKEAQYAARAAGHAVATAHVTRHSIGAAIYATAVIRELNPDNIDVAAKKEGDWQYKHLVKLRKFKKYKL